MVADSMCLLDAKVNFGTWFKALERLTDTSEVAGVKIKKAGI